MKKRKVYQLGEINNLHNPFGNSILTARKYIIATEGQEVYENIYTGMCDHIREQYGFNYYICLLPCTSNDEYIGALIFEVEPHGVTHVQRDENKKPYILVD